jgi:nucleotide-binding universal stress UspA family protein
MKMNKSFMSDTAVSTVSPESAAADLREILVPIDFSQSSVNALRHAAALAAKTKAHLTLLNVMDEPVSFRALDLAAQEYQRQHDHARQLQQLADRELAPTIAANLLVRTGNPSHEISLVAAQRHSDLIVMGRHEHHGLRRWFHGHTVRRVADNAPCPVMVLN